MIPNAGTAALASPSRDSGAFAVMEADAREPAVLAHKFCGGYITDL